MAETGEGIEPLHVNVEDAKISKGQDTDYGSILSMYSNDKTGELVQMCWIDAGKPFPGDQKGLEGGEELFIMDGSLKMQESGQEFGKWGWIRFPVDGDEKRDEIVAGSGGARVFRKTGHLTDNALGMEKIQITEED